MRLLIVQIGPSRIENFTLNQFSNLASLFSEIDCARIIWKSDESIKARKFRLTDDRSVTPEFNFVLNATIEQPTNYTLKNINCRESIKWSKNRHESNFFVTASQFIYTREVLRLVKPIKSYDYILKIRPDMILINNNELVSKMLQIDFNVENKLYTALNPHCHQSKQISDHFLFSSWTTFNRLWPKSMSHNFLFHASKYNPERLLKLQALLKNIHQQNICERYIDYWNYDTTPRSYDPPIFQKASELLSNSPYEIQKFLHD